jgi:hypothetical protein
MGQAALSGSDLNVACVIVVAVPWKSRAISTGIKLLRRSFDKTCSKSAFFWLALRYWLIMKGSFVAIQLNSQTKSPEGNWFIQDGKLKNEKPSPSAGGLGGRQAKCPLCSALRT